MTEPVKVTHHAHVHWMGRCGRPDEPRHALIESVYRSREATPHERRAADYHFKSGDRQSLHYRVDEETGILLGIYTDEDNDIWHVISCQLLTHVLADHVASRRYLKRAIRWKRKCRKILRLTDAERWRLVEGRSGISDEI